MYDLRSRVYPLSIYAAVRAHEPLRVSLADLHQADSKGKWWLVGAAWSGNPLVDRQEAEPAQDDVTLDDSEALATKALLKLARKQGMNTDVRRSVFVTIMSSEVGERNYFRAAVLMIS